MSALSEADFPTGRRHPARLRRYKHPFLLRFVQRAMRRPTTGPVPATCEPAGPGGSSALNWVPLLAYCVTQIDSPAACPQCELRLTSVAATAAFVA